MKIFVKPTAIYLLLISICLFSACGDATQIVTENQIAPNNQNSQTQNSQTISNSSSNTNSNSANNYSSKVPNLQAEILAQRNTKTNSPLGNFDFKNFTYPFPRGWQDSDSKEFTLENGSRQVSKERVGISFVTTLFGDANNDGQDEAIVILKIDTGGSAIPQIVYVYSWKENEPDLIWSFRTGDRADGGLKNIWTEKGSVVIELYGQDRYILGDTETLRITGDEEQISFPTFFTKTVYKWNGGNFKMDGKRLTYQMDNKNAPPVENMGDIIESQNK